MPKINAEGMPTSAGMEGHVLGADGREHEIDPSRNADGTVVDGYESDQRELKDRGQGEGPGVQDPPVPTEDNPAYREGRDADPQHPSDNDGNAQDQQREQAEQERQREGGGASSPGNSSPASPQKTASTRPKK